MISSYLSCILPRCSIRRTVALGLAMTFTAYSALTALHPQFMMANASTSTLFYDDFEGGVIADWEMSWGWSIVNASSDSDGKKARTIGSETMDAQLIKAVPTAKYTNIRLIYSYRVTGYDAGDVATVSYRSAAGQAWQELASYSANTSSWMSVSMPLPSETANQPNLEIRFASNANGTNDMFYVDSVMVQGEYVNWTDQEGPIIEDISHDPYQPWPSSDTLDNSLSVSAADPSEVDRVEFTFQSMVNQSLFFPALGGLATTLNQHGQYELVFDQAQLEALVDTLNLEVDGQFVWRIAAYDAFGNTTHRMLALVYTGNGFDELTDAPTDDPDQAAQVTVEDDLDTDSSLATPGSLTDNSESSNSAAGGTQVLGDQESQSLAGNSPSTAESGHLPTTGGFNLLNAGIGLFSLGLVVLAVYLYGLKRHAGFVRGVSLVSRWRLGSMVSRYY